MPRPCTRWRTRATRRCCSSAAGEHAATPEHPFGYGRSRYIYAFIVSIVLFSIGGLFALYEGYHKLGEPGGLVSPLIAVGVLSVAIIFESYALRTAVQESKKIPVWDAVATLGIGVLLVVIAIILAVETKSLLLGEATLIYLEPDLDASSTVSGR